MNREYCEREKELIQALRRGSLGAELERHAGSCPICADAVLVSRFLQNEFSTADATQPGPMLPDADFLWWKGQLAAKKAAVERATRSIELVRKASYFAFTAAALWLLFAPGHLSWIMSALSNYQLLANGSLRQTVLFTATGAIIFTILSSLYLARAEK
jgi:hypothetical protein